MDRFSAMTTFVRVVESGSLSAASRALSMPLTSVSRNINSLEERLGTRLLIRTTRHLGLTAEGQIYYDHAKRILGDVEDAELVLAKHSVEPTGRLVVSSPVVFGRLVIAPLVPKFLSLYPRVTVDLLLADRALNPIDEGSDIVVRLGALEDSSLSARKLGAVRRVVCGAPSYFRDHGEPKHPRDLKMHDCVLFTLLDTDPVWRFHIDGGDIAVPVNCRIRTNNADAALLATVGCAGLTLAPFPLVQKQIADGSLKVVLQQFEFPPTPIYALFPRARFLSPRVRTFMDCLSDYCSSASFAALFDAPSLS